MENSLSFPRYHTELTEGQVPEFMREGAPDVFFGEGKFKAALPSDPLALYMMAFAIGYRQAICDSRDTDRREMLEEMDKMLEKNFRSNK